mgnify:CR=1 FL=1
MALACSVKVACIVTSGSQWLDALIQLKMLVLMWVWHAITKLEFVPIFFYLWVMKTNLSGSS